MAAPRRPRLPPGERLLRTFGTDAGVRRRVLGRSALGVGFVGGMAAIFLVLFATDPLASNVGTAVYVGVVLFPTAFVGGLLILLGRQFARSSPVVLLVTDRRVIARFAGRGSRVASLTYGRIGAVRTPPGLYSYDGGPQRYWRPGERRNLESFGSPGGYQFVSILPRGARPPWLGMKTYPPLLPGEIRIPWMRVGEAEALRQLIAQRIEATRLLPEHAEPVDAPEFGFAPTSWRR